MRKDYLLAIAVCVAAVTPAFANPVAVAPVVAPVTRVSVSAVPAKEQALNTYRAVRAFWMSRAIVR